MDLRNKAIAGGGLVYKVLDILLEIIASQVIH